MPQIDRPSTTMLTACADGPLKNLENIDER